MSNTTQNDHETHTACIGRIKKEGASSTCCYCNPHEGCTLGIKPTQNKYKTMDEYEKELNKKGIYTKPKIKRDKAEDIVFGWMIECDGDLDKQSAKVLTDEIRLALADARKEEREGIARWFETDLQGVFNGKQIAELIRLLTTQKEEQI